MHLSKGTSLKFGSYVIEAVLGQGGFGITYVAEQVGLGRKVAIKEFFMRDLCNRDTDTSYVSVPSVGSKELVDRFRSKFVKEARMIAEMEDRHIVKIYDVFEENGTAYYVMEYIPGGSLKDSIPAGGFSESVAVEYIRQIADALRYIHEEKHVLHLDVKPENMLVRKNGELVLIDFGISKHYDNGGGSQTSSTPVAVSRGYAPLEQYNAGGVSQFSPATDIYSLGAVFYKLVTGQTPPEASIVLDAGIPELPADVSASVKAAIMTAMQPRRPERPQSIDEFLRMLNSSSGKSQASDQTLSEGTHAEDTEIVADDSVLEAEAVTPETEFRDRYNKLMASQKYKEAFALCCRNMKVLPLAQKMLPETEAIYFQNCGKSVCLPATEGVSYKWLYECLKADGIQELSISDRIYVDTVHVGLYGGDEGVEVVVKANDGFKGPIRQLLARILGTALLVAGVMFLSIALEDDFKEEAPLVFGIASFVVSIWLLVKLSNRTDKTIKTVSKVLSDALIKKWCEK